MGFLIVALLSGILLSLPPVQTFLGKYATNYLNKEFGTNTSIQKVAITPYGTVKLKGILTRDHHNDTLFYIKRLNTSILSVKELYNNGHPYFGAILIEGLNFKITQYKGEDFKNIDKFIDSFDDGTPSSTPQMAYDVSNYLTFIQRKVGAKMPDKKFKFDLLILGFLLLAPLRYVAVHGKIRGYLVSRFEAYAVRDGNYYKHFRTGQKSLKAPFWRGVNWA